MRTAVHLRVLGNVQGVGFRAFTKKHAQRRGITGWVKNTPKGDVEIFAEGEEPAINELIALAKKGPFTGTTLRVIVEKRIPQKFACFSVLL